MRHCNHNRKRYVIRLFWLSFSISMFLILGVAISQPLNNLIPEKMFLYTMVWIGMYFGAWIFFSYLEQKIENLMEIVKRYYTFYFVILGIVLFIVSCCLRSVPITDYENIYNAAKLYAMGEEVTNWDYFARWTNNIGVMLLLSLLFYLCNWLPEQVDSYYFVLILNVLFIVLLVYCLHYLLNAFLTEDSAVVSLMTLFVCGTWIPFYANASIFYSDQLSLGFAVYAFTLLVKGHSKLRWYFYYLCSGILLGLGISVKVTVATIIVSLTITGFLFSEVWKNKRRMIIVLGGCVAYLSLFSVYTRTLPYQEWEGQLKAPVEYWFALGLVADGTYADNEEFAVYCLTAENYEQRREIAREKIKAEILNLWDGEHIIQKARQNFGAGDLGAARYFHIPVQENFLWNCCSMNGEYFWKYACVTTAFFFAVLFYMGVGGLLQFFKKDTTEEMGFFLAALTFWGICLFMMLWEAQDKFMYNHSGWMIITLICSFKLIDEQGRKFLKNIKGVVRTKDNPYPLSRTF